MTYKGVEIGNSPTLAIIEEYIAVKGFDVDAKEVYDKYSERGWRTLKHQPLKSVEAMANAQNGIVVSKKRRAGLIPTSETPKTFAASASVYGRYDAKTNTGRWGYQIKFGNYI